MSEFAKYERMRHAGATPPEVYRAGRADGLDAIERIRLVRTVYGLSLAEAKRVSGAAAVWDATPDLVAGADVAWAGRDPMFGPYYVEATVADVSGNAVRLDLHRLSFVTPAGLAEVVTTGSATVSAAALARPLAERLGDTLAALPEHPGLRSKAV